MWSKWPCVMRILSPHLFCPPGSAVAVGGCRETPPFLLWAAYSPQWCWEAMEVGVPVAKAAQQSSFTDLFHLPNFNFAAWLSVCLGKGECLLTSAGSLQLLLRIKCREMDFFVHLKALFYQCNTLPWQCLSPGLEIWLRSFLLKEKKENISFVSLTSCLRFGAALGSQPWRRAQVKEATGTGSAVRGSSGRQVSKCCLFFTRTVSTSAWLFLCFQFQVMESIVKLQDEHFFGQPLRSSHWVPVLQLPIGLMCAPVAADRIECFSAIFNVRLQINEN